MSKVLFDASTLTVIGKDDLVDLILTLGESIESSEAILQEATLALDQLGTSVEAELDKREKQNGTT